MEYSSSHWFTRFSISPDSLMDSFCEYGCAYNGITDAVTNLLMKVQHVTVSENSDHNSCVSLTKSGLGISYSLGKRDGICSIGYISLISIPGVL